MSNFAKVAFVAALEREIRPLIKGWRVTEREYDGRRFKFFENERAVLVCGGVGAEAARRATEAVIAMYQPSSVTSVGFVGALDPALKCGEVLVPRCVVDARDGSSIDTGAGNGVLVSVPAIAGQGQKSKLAKAYGAQAIDMEAAAVARGAEARGKSFSAVKVISDESNFAMPPVEGFVGPDGVFSETGFALFAVSRPWLWRGLIRLARNSRRASRALCDRLEQFTLPAQDSGAPELQEPSRTR